MILKSQTLCRFVDVSKNLVWRIEVVQITSHCLGADGVLKFTSADEYHPEDSEGCIQVAEKFRQFNQSSRNTLPGNGD